MIDKLIFIKGKPPFNLPARLYHGSMFFQEELMPGYKRSGELVEWDITENNTWLYASSSRKEAILMGIASAIEKSFILDRYQYDEKNDTITITVSGKKISPNDIFNLKVFLYTIRPTASDGWEANKNPMNGSTSEYKTKETIQKSILSRERIDVRKALAKFRLKIIMAGN